MGWCCALHNPGAEIHVFFIYGWLLVWSVETQEIILDIFRCDRIFIEISSTSNLTKKQRIRYALCVSVSGEVFERPLIFVGKFPEMADNSYHQRCLCVPD
jgi:hypothetical protein